MNANPRSIVHLVTAWVLFLAPLADARAQEILMPDLKGLTLEQASTTLKGNMSIGGDEVGTKPPTQDDALRIYFQDPPAGTPVDKHAKVKVAVKRYGEWNSGEGPDPEPTPVPDTGGSSTGGSGTGVGSGVDGMIGTWDGTVKMPGMKPRKTTVIIDWSNGKYYVTIGENGAAEAKIKGSSLVVVDGDNALGFKYTFTLTGDDELIMDLIASTDVGGQQTIKVRTPFRRRK